MNGIGRRISDLQSLLFVEFVISQEARFVAGQLAIHICGNRRLRTLGIPKTHVIDHAIAIDDGVQVRVIDAPDFQWCGGVFHQRRRRLQGLYVNLNAVTENL